MKKIFLAILLGIFLIGATSAFSICIDKTPPSPPSNLAVSGNVGNIILTWNAATDVPSCSGIESYTIKRVNPDNSIVLLGTVGPNTLTFTDTDSSLTAGSYSYIVYATDKAGHNTGNSIKNDVVINPSNGGGPVSGGGGGSSYVCTESWVCGKWNSCINGTQTRTCTDNAMCGTNLIEPATTQSCSNPFTPLSTNLPNINESQTINSSASAGTSITGAVIGALTSPVGIGSLGALVLVVVLAIIIVPKRKSKVSMSNNSVKQ